MNSFESTIHNIPPLLSLWRENVENIITQNVLTGKFQQLNVTGTKWPWASTINRWMNTPQNCQEKSQKFLAKLSYSYLSLSKYTGLDVDFVVKHNQYQM